MNTDLCKLGLLDLAIQNAKVRKAAVCKSLYKKPPISLLFSLKPD